MIERAPYSREQSRHLDEVADTWRELAPHLLEQQELVGGLQWKTIAGNEYLYRYQPNPITKKKKSTSLGRRSPDTEAAYNDFMLRREIVANAIATSERELESQARVTKALRLGRVPVDIAKLLRTLWSAQLSDHLLLVSDHAVFGYESLFRSQIGGHGGHDLHFCALEDGLLEEIFPTLEHALRAADKTAEIQIVGSQIRVDGRHGSILFSTPYDFVTQWAHRTDATDEQAGTLIDLLSWEPLPVLTLSRSGEPVPMQVPDPRAFAFMTTPLDGETAEIGFTIAVMASETEHYAFPDDLLEVMPSLAESLGFRGIGPTI
jgi:hypothetical protein